jgi:dUTP pyrophosphatase
MYELKDNELVFAKVKPNAIIPTKEDENAGYDIYACFEEDFMVIPAHETRLIPTGIASAMTSKWYLQVEERGSTGSKGIKKSAGVIDSGYRNEIFIALTNANSNDLVISKLTREELIEKHGKKDEFGDVVLDYGDKEHMVYLVSDDEGFYDMSAIIYPYSKAIAQLVVHEVPKMEVNEISYEELLAIPSTRGVGALGSSGK